MFLPRENEPLYVHWLLMCSVLQALDTIPLGPLYNIFQLEHLTSDSLCQFKYSYSYTDYYLVSHLILISAHITTANVVRQNVLFDIIQYCYVVTLGY